MIKNHIKKLMDTVKFKLRKFNFLRVYFSPFKLLKPVVYFGKVKVGTPIFLPRRWKKYTPEQAKEKALRHYNNYMKSWSFQKKYDYFIKCQYSVPKKVGFDFTPLQWKTKWSDTDFRFEYNPVWSFVFWGYQLAIIWKAPYSNHFWESWLLYDNATDKSKSRAARIAEAKKINPNVYKSYRNGTEKVINYWDLLLK